jgi:hypothetical protein
MKFTTVLICALLISGCSSTYQKRDNNSYGYTDQILSTKLYVLQYYEMHMWSKSDGRSKWIQRAAELCHPDQFSEIEYFEQLYTLGQQTSFSLIGSTPAFYYETETAALSQGYVLCNGSQLSQEEVEEIIRRTQFCIKTDCRLSDESKS